MGSDRGGGQEAEVRDVIGWGIVGTGGIAATFAESMPLVEDGRVVAVASRTRDRAAAFAGTWSVERAYDDVAAMAADPRVDVVYVATPHARHHDDALVALGAGRPVLVEKPFALTSTQASRVLDAAEARGAFVMEAMWSRFLPAYVELAGLLADGAIGTPLQVSSDFGIPAPDDDPTHRLLDPRLGGGALLDLGVYPLQLAHLALGPVDDVAAVGVLGPTGVDVQVAVSTRHAAGGVATSRASIAGLTGCTARIDGTAGSITLPAFAHAPHALTLERAGAAETRERPYAGPGLQYEIAEVHRCLRAGLTESPIMPWSATLALAATMDAVRDRIGLAYPDE